jgi:hypothetical protein
MYKANLIEETNQTEAKQSLQEYDTMQQWEKQLNSVMHVN